MTSSLLLLLLVSMPPVDHRCMDAFPICTSGSGGITCDTRCGVAFGLRFHERSARLNEYPRWRAHVAELARAHPALRFAVTAHAKPQESADASALAGLREAAAIRFLVDMGIDRDRIVSRPHVLANRSFQAEIVPVGARSVPRGSMPPLPDPFTSYFALVFREASAEIEKEPDAADFQDCVTSRRRVRVVAYASYLEPETHTLADRRLRAALEWLRIRGVADVNIRVGTVSLMGEGIALGPGSRLATITPLADDVPEPDASLPAVSRYVEHRCPCQRVRGQVVCDSWPHAALALAPQGTVLPTANLDPDSWTMLHALPELRVVVFLPPRETLNKAGITDLRSDVGRHLRRLGLAEARVTFVEFLLREDRNEKGQMQFWYDEPPDSPGPTWGWGIKPDLTTLRIQLRGDRELSTAFPHDWSRDVPRPLMCQMGRSVEYREADVGPAEFLARPPPDAAPPTSHARVSAEPEIVPRCESFAFRTTTGGDLAAEIAAMNVRDECVQSALWRLGEFVPIPSEAEPGLMKFLAADVPVDTWSAAVGVLGYSTDPAVLQRLHSFTGDSDAFRAVRVSHMLLVQHHDERGYQALRRRLLHEKADRAARLKLARSFVPFIHPKPQDVLDVYIALLTDDDVRMRYFASRTLQEYTGLAFRYAFRAAPKANAAALRAWRSMAKHCGRVLDASARSGRAAHRHHRRHRGAVRRWRHDQIRTRGHAGGGSRPPGW